MRKFTSPSLKARAFILLTLQIILLSHVNLSAREFTDTKGRKIEAELTGATLDGKVQILRKGKKSTVPIKLFSLDDQEYIREWIKSHPDALSYRFNYYADLTVLRKQNSSRNGSMISDKLISKPQRMLINVTNLNPNTITDLKIVVDAVIDDAVNVVDGSYSRLAVGSSRKDVVTIQRFRAQGEFPSIAPKGRAELTFEFDIERYVDRDGGKVDGTATDRVLGAWIRIYKGDKMIDEFKRSFESKFDKVQWNDKRVSKPRNVETKTK